MTTARANAATERCPLCRQRREIAHAPLLPPKLVRAVWQPDDQSSFRFESYGRRVVEPGWSAGVPIAVPLCADCRQRLWIWEDLFARQVVREPVHDGRTVVAYSRWLPRLVASLAWRVLASLLDAGNTFALPEHRDQTLAAMEAWREYVAGRRSSPDPFHLHMLPIARVADDVDQAWYAREVVHLLPVETRTGDVWVWMKLPQVLLIGTIDQRRGSALTDSRLQTDGSAVWGDAPVHVPGIVRFLMFEELQRSIYECEHAIEHSSVQECNR